MRDIWRPVGMMAAASVVACGLAGAQEPAQVGYYVYVAAESEDEVAVVRFGSEGAGIVERVPVGLLPTEIDGPHGIAIDPRGSNWYVSIAHGMPFGQVHKYSLGENEKVGTVEVGLFPATMSMAETGLLFVVNFNLHGDPVPSSVSVVETSAMVEIVRVPTCAMPHGSRLSADGRKHYSVCMMDDQVVEIDARELTVSRRLYVGPGAERELPPESTESATAIGRDPGMSEAPRCGPTWIQPAPDGRHAFVACNRNREILEIDLRDWAVTRRFRTGAGPYNLDVTPDGQTLVVTYKGEAAVGVFDLASGEERATVRTSRRVPHGVVVSPDSRYAFISVEGVGSEPGAVDIIDLRTGELAASAETGRQAGGIGFWKVESPAE